MIQSENVEIRKHLKKPSYSEVQQIPSNPSNDHFVRTFNLTDDELQKIYREFRQICKQDTSDMTIDENSLIPVNTDKNRYPDVLPLKNTAVKLDSIGGVAGSDYINANFVRDINCGEVKQKHSYICCQAPLSSTFGDFWRMIWMYKVSVIVMITNLVERNRVKADPYWPEQEGQINKYDGYCVKLCREVKRNSSVTVRYLKLWKATTTPPVQSSGHESFSESEGDGDGGNNDYDYGGSASDDETPVDSGGYEDSSSSDHEPVDDQGVRRVAQLHCTNWPDYGVPSSTQVMKDLINEVNMRCGLDFETPIVVHCSAGIGRTGTFVAIHMCIQKDLHGEKINILETVRHLRAQRLGMVQSKEQYMFVYAVVGDIIKERRDLAAVSGRTSADGKVKLARQMTINKQNRGRRQGKHEKLAVSNVDKRRIKSDKKRRRSKVTPTLQLIQSENTVISASSAAALPINPAKRILQQTTPLSASLPEISIMSNHSAPSVPSVSITSSTTNDSITAMKH